jgi:hypothetical protein
MIAASVMVGSSLMMMGWTKEVASLFLSTDSERYSTLVIRIAVISIYFLDFALNTDIFPHYP